MTVTVIKATKDRGKLCDPLHSPLLVQGPQDPAQGLGLFHRAIWDISLGKHLRATLIGKCVQCLIVYIFTFGNIHCRLQCVSVLISSWFTHKSTAVLCEERVLHHRVDIPQNPAAA